MGENGKQLPQQDGKEYSQTQREKPQRGRRRSYWADPAQLAGGTSRIEDEPAGVAALQQKKGQCSHSAVNQVSHSLRLLIAMRAFYELSLWIPPIFVSGTQTCTHSRPN